MKAHYSDQWLTDYSREHLFHELTMFGWLARNIRSNMDTYLHDGLLESFVVHLRNLICFFCRDGSDDDVVAADFFDNPSEWSPIESTMLREARIRANKEMSHLTAARKADVDPAKPWDVVALYREIETVTKDFASRASKTKLHEKVRELLRSPTVTFVLGEHSHSTTAMSKGVMILHTLLPPQRKTP